MVYILPSTNESANYLLPLFQNEFSWKTFHMKTSLIGMKILLLTQGQKATRKWPFMWSLNDILTDIFPPPGKFKSLWVSHQSILIPHTCRSSKCFLHSSPRMTSEKENRLSCFNPPYPPPLQPRLQIQAYSRKPRVILTGGKWCRYSESQKGSLWFGRNITFFR